MTNEEILDDIKVIIEAEYAKRGETQGRVVVSFPDEIVPLLNLLSNKLGTEKEKKFFWQTLEEIIDKEPQPSFSIIDDVKQTSFLIQSAADRILIFFIKSGKVDTALNYFNLERNINYYLRNVIRAIDNLLTNEPHYFDRNALTRLEKGLSNILLQIDAESEYEKRYNVYQRQVAENHRIVAVDGVKLEKPSRPQAPKKPRLNYVKADRENSNFCTLLINAVIMKIRIAKLNILKISYQGINLEINQDKEELKLKIKEFNFNPELSECLDKFEIDYQKATDNFDLKSCIGHIRTFTERLVVSIAQKISKKIKVSPNASIESMGGARQYLRDGRVDFLSQKQDDFLGSFYGLASDEHIGAHSLTSDREHARIIKNEGIELGLFLVKLLDKYLNQTKNPII